MKTAARMQRVTRFVRVHGRRHRLAIVLVAVVFAALGILVMRQSQAVSYVASAEAESGGRAGNAGLVAGNGASGSQAVRFGSGGTPGAGLGRLRVGPDNRSFVTADGSPFFWVGDTAWSLFVNLTRDETLTYLNNRQANGFNVIQAVAVGTPSGQINGNDPNRQGDRPYASNLGSPTTTPGNNPANATEYDYWDHIDYVIQEAGKRNMYVALLPTWSRNTAGHILTTGNANAYGAFLGQRYKDYSNIIWVMGGDESSSKGDFPEIWRPLARAITIGVAGSEDYSRTLMTYHPGGGRTSVTTFHNDAWLDFNMYQSSHRPFQDNPSIHSNLSLAYGKTPVKPFLDGEPMYEEHPINFDAGANGYSNANQTRLTAWMESQSGAAGHTYGHHNVWSMYGTPAGGKGAELKPIHWSTAINSAGGRYMGYLRKAVDSRLRDGVFRVRDQGLIRSDAFGNTNAAIRATRGSDNSYIMVYSGQGRSFTVDTSRLSGSAINAWWYDPRNGTATAANVARGTSVQLTPPSGSDWVLVADDASRGYRPPGQ